MENVFLTSLTTPEVRQLFKEELSKFFAEHQPAASSIEVNDQFTIAELADYLKCTKNTIQVYKRRGIFPYYQTGRTVFFKKSEVDKALAVGTKKKGASN